MDDKWAANLAGAKALMLVCTKAEMKALQWVDKMVKTKVDLRASLKDKKLETDLESPMVGKMAELKSVLEKSYEDLVVKWVQ